MVRQTTVRFSEPVYGRLEEASAVTGLPINSILVVAAMDWLAAHPPERLGSAGTGRRSPDPALPSEPEDLVPSMLPFERLDGSARRALALALQEARGRVGVGAAGMRRVGAGSVTQVGSEDLLVGLLRARDGVAAQVLHRLGVDVERVRGLIAARPREALAYLLPRGLEAVGGPETQAVIPEAVPTRRLQAAIAIAFTQAKQLGDTVVGSEHLLLGLTIDDEGLADHLLKELAVTRDRVMEEVRMLRAGAESTEGDEAPSTDAP
jgi:ATP-dependent Clp protease ATP-binding subunit ClpA